MLPAKALTSPFPAPPTPSSRELASNVYAKFASYLLRDLATRLQGGADGVGRRAQTSVSPPLDLAFGFASYSTGPSACAGCNPLTQILFCSFMPPFSINVAAYNRSPSTLSVSARF